MEQERPLNVLQLLNATKGFDYLFTDDITAARKHFELRDDPFHLLGLGVCAFLEAALGMESGLMTEASRCLSLAEVGTRKHMKAPKPPDLSYRSRFRYGLEWEILNADAVVLLGLTRALNESYMGYLQCMYALNSAHSKFTESCNTFIRVQMTVLTFLSPTRLYKTVFPQGLPRDDRFSNSFSRLLSSEDQSPLLSHKISSSSDPSLSTTSTVSPTMSSRTGNSFFSRWLGTATLSVPTLPSEISQDGPIEDLIVSGTAFGFGLFNLVLSLLPKKVRGIVGFFGFHHDRSLALRALVVSAGKLDVHGVFASLVLMTYISAVLLLSGYQADEQRMLKGYEEIISNVEGKYPSGTLWILNRAKLKRMACDTAGATVILQDGLKMDRPRLFVQADIMMYFELAWTLLSQTRYHEAGEAFMAVTKLNSWSHGTYYFIAGGCYLAAGNIEKAQKLFDAIPEVIARKKVAGREIPTEVFIKKKLAYYLEKQSRRGGGEQNWVEAIKINPAEEIGIFWNMHSHVAASIAQYRIECLTALTPPVSNQRLENHASPSGSLPVRSDAKLSPDDLDNPEELAVRALLLGINYRTTTAYEMARHFLVEASRYPVVINTWVTGVAMFESAVLDLKETEMYTKGHDMDREHLRSTWADTLKSANVKLDVALQVSGSDVDLSGRLDSRIALLRDEIAAKKEMEGA